MAALEKLKFFSISVWVKIPFSPPNCVSCPSYRSCLDSVLYSWALEESATTTGLCSSVCLGRAVTWVNPFTNKCSEYTFIHSEHVHVTCFDLLTTNIKYFKITLPPEDSAVACREHFQWAGKSNSRHKHKLNRDDAIMTGHFGGDVYSMITAAVPWVLLAICYTLKHVKIEAFSSFMQIYHLCVQFLFCFVFFTAKSLFLPQKPGVHKTFKQTWNRVSTTSLVSSSLYPKVLGTNYKILKTKSSIHKLD